jgi:hypothetical protein
MTLLLPPGLFQDAPPKLIERYAKRAAVEEPHELRRHGGPLRAALLAAYLHRRSEELTDHLVDLLIETIQKMTKRAEKKVEEELAGQLQKVPGKIGVLVRMAEASLDSPEGAVKEVIFPVASENLLRKILQEIRTAGPATEMEVERQYVDSHGQSVVAFAFCRLLGFELMPRIKAIHSQRLSRPEPGQSFPNLDLVMASRNIDWELIEQQLDAMVKHAVGMKRGMADAESLLRRFTRNNAPHPAYKALAELGKAIKTLFLCRYLASEELRREVNEGLNMVESWNAANGFIFYGRGGELATNRREDQEMGFLCRHLLQSSLVYINTLMIQRVLADATWSERMTPRDLGALSPLLTQHINPYGRFELDMGTRLLEIES